MKCIIFVFYNWHGECSTGRGKNEFSLIPANSRSKHHTDCNILFVDENRIMILKIHKGLPQEAQAGGFVMALIVPQPKLH